MPPARAPIAPPTMAGTKSDHGISEGLATAMLQPNRARSSAAMMASAAGTIQPGGLCWLTVSDLPLHVRRDVAKIFLELPAWQAGTAKADRMPIRPRAYFCRG